MNKKNMFFGATAFVLGAILLLPQATYAYKGDPSVQGPNYTVERHADMTMAFANKDYTAWKALMGDKGITRKITAENFARFAQAHELAAQGKTAEANAIKAELGLGQGNGNNNGGGNRGNCTMSR